MSRQESNEASPDAQNYQAEYQPDYQVILMVGKKDPEFIENLSIGLSEDTLIQCIHVEELKDLESTIKESLPDLILIFDSGFDDKKQISDFCQDFRSIPQEHRSVLAIQTEGLSDQRIEYLTKGADDVLDNNLDIEELGVRLLVHLRRNLDSITHPVSYLPGLPLVSRVFSRRANRSQEWALVSIEINFFNAYLEAYGELAGNQVIRSLVSILQQVVIVPDCICHTENNVFFLLTAPEKAEKIVSILCRQFENTAPNFYSDKDRKQGFMMSASSQKISRRIPLLSLSIGAASSLVQYQESFNAAYNKALEMKSLARMSPGSHWIIQRPKLSGEREEQVSRSQHILVVESDAALAYLLKTTLDIEGYTVTVTSSIEDAKITLENETVCLTILDALIHGTEEGLSLSSHIKKNHSQTRILCISTLHNREKVLQSGADLYLPKPFELTALFNWIDSLLKGY